MEEVVKQKAVIIGAGIGGIATANILAKAGYEVDVFEKNDQLGGRAGVFEKDGFRFDTGPSWYLMPEVFEHYFSLFNKDVNTELDLLRLSPAYKVFFEQEKPLVITSDLETDTRTFESIEPGAGKQLSRYVTQSEQTYRLALKHFLYSNFSSLRDFAHPAVLSRAYTMTKLAFTPVAVYVNRYFRDRRLKRILEYPMVFLGTSPFSAPALYSLMSALDFVEGVFYPRGGIYTIIERLLVISEELGVRYHPGTEVQNITVEKQKASGIRLSSGELIPADIVISNADLHFTETQLLEKAHRTYPETYWQKKQPGPSALLVYLGISGELPTLEHHNLLFVDSWKENFDRIYHKKLMPKPASLYICKPSASDESVAPTGHENIFVLVPLPAGKELSEQETKLLTKEYLEQIASMTNIPDFTDRIVSQTIFGPSDFKTKFYAWQSTALGPSHLLRQSAFFRTRNKSKKLSNLYYVGGATVPGIGLPMCLISAELIYKRLTGDVHSGPVASIKNEGSVK